MINLSTKQFSIFKATLFLLALVPFIRLCVFAYANWLGANPIEFITRNTGDWALYFLCFTLALSPIRRLTKWGQILRLRRMLGLYVFFYATLHLMTFFWFDHFFDISEAMADVMKRPFIMVGIIVFVLLIPLTVTSTNNMVKRLGAKRWKWLHRLVYVVGPLAILHFWWMKAGKNDFFEPALYGAVIATLLMMRIYWNMQEAFDQRKQGDLGQTVSNPLSANPMAMKLSLIDPLTGVKNRASFHDKLNQEWRRALRRQYSVGLLMVDIDHFKRINDIYGRLGGDACLNEVAKVIQDNIHRSGDELFRNGGDDYAVVLPDTDLPGATYLAKSLVKDGQALQIQYDGKSIPVTFSIGVASMIPRSDASEDALIAAADSALALAKGSGIGQIHVCSPPPEVAKNNVIPLHSE